MFEIEFKGQRISTKAGKKLRRVLLEANCSPHNGQAQWLNCRGMGTCGTCAVEVLKGDAGLKTAVEKWRLKVPPHKESSGLRLACQLTLKGPLVLKKYSGFWGERKL
jgi:ferredoxin